MIRIRTLSLIWGQMPAIIFLSRLMLFVWREKLKNKKKGGGGEDNDGTKTDQWRWCKTSSERTLREKATGPLLSHHSLSSFPLFSMKKPRVVVLHTQRDFDAPMDTERKEKIVGAGASNLPPWANISKPQTFSIAKWNADAVHEGKS